MRAVRVSEPNSPLTLTTCDTPEPGPGEVRIRVEACGICHSDSLTLAGVWPGMQYPRVPGHEVAGVVDAVGPGVAAWTPGRRAGVGWHGGECHYCDNCRRGDFFACRNVHEVTGLTRDGGYAEHLIARSEALAAVPDGLSSEDAAPLMCAGVTTFNALRNSGACPGDLVAIHGLGGLGHLGVQFAARMGFRTVAIARGADKGELATQLGALHYIDSTAADPAAELIKLGGAKVILATVTDAAAMESVLGGLGANGQLLAVGAVQSIAVPIARFIAGRQSVKAWYSGSAIDSEDTLAFAARTGVRSMNELYPLKRAAEGYARMMSGKARFRVVLKM
jgi:D-arabinose 1-dehydrogenase-like Zn-dependent alcohol dehydrogenase